MFACRIRDLLNIFLGGENGRREKKRKEEEDMTCVWEGNTSLIGEPVMCSKGSSSLGGIELVWIFFCVFSGRGRQGFFHAFIIVIGVA